MQLLQQQDFLEKYLPNYRDLHPPEVSKSSVDSILTLKGIDFSYRKKNWLGKIASHHVLSNISLELFPSLIYALLGESGAGKTTLFKIICSCLKPDAGDTLLMQKDVKVLRETGELPQMIQIIPQDNGLNPSKKIYAILDRTLKVYTKKNFKDRQKLILEIIAKVGLTTEVLEKYPFQLSGGQKKRIAIARSVLAPDLKLLVADEPFSGLDYDIRKGIIQLFLELQKQKNFALLLVSHELDILPYFCNEVMVLHKGSIVEKGKPANILQNPQHPYTQSLVQASLPSLENFLATWANSVDGK